MLNKADLSTMGNDIEQEVAQLATMREELVASWQQLEAAEAGAGAPKPTPSLSSEDTLPVMPRKRIVLFGDSITEVEPSRNSP